MIFIHDIYMYLVCTPTLKPYLFPRVSVWVWVCGCVCVCVGVCGVTQTHTELVSTERDRELLSSDWLFYRNVA